MSKDLDDIAKKIREIVSGKHISIPWIDIERENNMTNEKAPDLLPCAFCGGDAIIINLKHWTDSKETLSYDLVMHSLETDFNDFHTIEEIGNLILELFSSFRIECVNSFTSCKMRSRTTYYKSVKEAAFLWNTRAKTPTLDEFIKLVVRDERNACAKIAAASANDARRIAAAILARGNSNG